MEELKIPSPKPEDFEFDEIKLMYHFSNENFIPFRNKKSQPNMTNKEVFYLLENFQPKIQANTRHVKEFVLDVIDGKVDLKQMDQRVVDRYFYIMEKLMKSD